MAKHTRTRGRRSRSARVRGALGALDAVRRGPSALRAVLKRAGLARRLKVGLTGSLHTRGLLLWGAALLTGILCVSQHVYSTQLAEEIEDLKNSRKVVEAEIGFLSVEQARLSSRERIEEYATERLGMRYPEAHEVVRLGDGAQDSWDRWGDDLVEGSGVAVSDG